MRLAPKTAGAFAAGAFLFLLIFGVGWPGPGTWLLVFALLSVGAGAAAWWLDGSLVPSPGGVRSLQGRSAVAAVGVGSPFAGRPRRRDRGAWLLALGLPTLDGRGRWLLPDQVHVAMVAGTIGLLALVIFLGGAVGGGGASGAPAEVPAVQPSPILDFAKPVQTTTLPESPARIGVEPTPITIETPSTTRPAPARPIQATSAPREPGKTAVHEVVAGDTIYDLAIAYNTSMEAIVNANGIGEHDTIRVGQRLIIPEPSN